MNERRRQLACAEKERAASIAAAAPLPLLACCAPRPRPSPRNARARGRQRPVVACPAFTQALKARLALEFLLLETLLWGLWSCRWLAGKVCAVRLDADARTLAPRSPRRRRTRARSLRCKAHSPTSSLLLPSTGHLHHCASHYITQHPTQPGRLAAHETSTHSLSQSERLAPPARPSSSSCSPNVAVRVASCLLPAAKADTPASEAGAALAKPHQAGHTRPRRRAIAHAPRAAICATTPLR